MCDLVSSNAVHDPNHFLRRRLLNQGSVKARTALLDVSEVKGRHIGDGLDVIVALEVAVGFAFVIGIGSGNCGNTSERNRLRKGRAEIRIGCAAIANVPTGVDVQIHEVREPQLAG